MHTPQPELGSPVSEQVLKMSACLLERMTYLASLPHIPPALGIRPTAVHLSKEPDGTTQILAGVLPT